jgi:hypothetical protein
MPYHKKQILHILVTNLSDDTIICYGTREKKKQYGKNLYSMCYQSGLYLDPWDTTTSAELQNECCDGGKPSCIVLLPGEKYDFDLWIPPNSYTYDRSLLYRYQVLKGHTDILNKIGPSSKNIKNFLSKTDSQTIPIPLHSRFYGPILENNAL